MLYTIEEGKHYCSPRKLGLHTRKTSSTVVIRFEESCLYTPLDKEHDWNKLFGWTYGLLNDKNSLRVGWRQSPYSNEVLQLCIYAHVNGVIRTTEQSLQVFPDEPYILKLEYDKNTKIAKLALMGMAVMPLYMRNLELPVGWGWDNYPYFGGQGVAPHKMKIWIS